MYSALVELMQPEIDEAVNQAEAKKTVEAIDNIMTKLGMSKTDACTCMDTTPEQYDAYKQMVSHIQNTAGRNDQ